MDVQPYLAFLAEHPFSVVFWSALVDAAGVPFPSRVILVLTPAFLATETDLQQLETKTAEEVKAHALCLDKIADHQLPMKLVDAIYTLDFSRLTFLYTSEGRVDFRELLKDLTSTFKRTRILLHLVDIAPPDPDADPVAGARAIVKELKKFSPELAKKPRWLVLNKIDLLEPAERKKRCADIVRRVRFKGPVFQISGATGEGTKELCQAVMRELERQ